MLKASEDEHNILQLGLGLAEFDLSPSAADKLKSDFGGRSLALEIRRLLLPMVVVTSTLLAANLAASDDPTGALIALERSWVAPLESSDIKTLSALWAQAYVDTNESGHRSDKAEVSRGSQVERTEAP